ncbi:MAG: serine/threonine protein kinase [Kofleriaceae bacterium]|nr:serine/threonine protein kinase [Kofleriaceae bacterium]
MAKNTVIGGRYELLERVAEGGMAIVWRGKMRGAAGFSRLVAVKEIKMEYREVPRYIEMFIEEARVGTVLAHPNIVQVVDFVVESRTHYLVLEWVDGVDLSAFTRAFSYLDQPIPWPLAVAAVIGALRGLDAAHSRVVGGVASPVIHRDISPQNILLSTNGTAKLSDFGLARAKDRAIAQVTTPGMLKGKVSYFAPEITRGDSASVLSDQFSMACVLWEVLSAQRLFEGISDSAIFSSIRSGQVPSIQEKRPDVPTRVADVLNRALSTAPEDRYASAGEWAHELSECLRTLGGGLFDANQRLAAAVVVAVETVGGFEDSETISAAQMNEMTISLNMNVESAVFRGPTQSMSVEIPKPDADD